jgi:hypothetical protein
MAWVVTKKNIKIHTCIDGIDSVEDTKVTISHKKLKALGAKRRVYKDTKEIFFLIESDCEIIL